MKKSQPAADSFEARYPHIVSWVQDGWIEMGRDDCARSFVRALDIGGLRMGDGARKHSGLPFACLFLPMLDDFLVDDFPIHDFGNRAHVVIVLELPNTNELLLRADIHHIGFRSYQMTSVRLAS